jgi:hypothetical protein
MAGGELSRVGAMEIGPPRSIPRSDQRLLQIILNVARYLHRRFINPEQGILDLSANRL